MMKRTVTILGTIYLLFHLLFLWMYTNIDGYFYWAIGHYFKTGVYPFINPFIYAKPITISPPLYGLFLAFIGSLPRGDIFLHIAHIMLIASTSLLLFRILTKIISPNSAALISFLFLIFPANVIYTNSMMTEIPAQTAMTLYLYLVHKKRLGPALLLASVMTILKYQFLFLFLTTCIMCIRTFRRQITYIAVGCCIIGLWIITNHAVTGVWGLSDTKKMPFYTNMVWDGKYYPSESDTSVLALRKYVPTTADRYGEYWDLQDYILPYTGRDWRSVDELLGNVGIAAIHAHPLAYLTNGMRIFIQTLIHRAPWFDNLESFGTVDPVQPLYCGRLGTIQFCQPIINTPISYSLWNMYVKTSRAFYNLFMPSLLLFIFLPSLIITLIDTRWNVKFYSIVYLINLVPISYLSMVESRYLIPYYPLMIIILTYGTTIIHTRVNTLIKPPIKKIKG